MNSIFNHGPASSSQGGKEQRRKISHQPSLTTTTTTVFPPAPPKVSSISEDGKKRVKKKDNGGERTTSVTQIFDTTYVKKTSSHYSVGGSSSHSISVPLVPVLPKEENRETTTQLESSRSRSRSQSQSILTNLATSNPNYSQNLQNIDDVSKKLDQFKKIFNENTNTFIGALLANTNEDPIDGIRAEELSQVLFAGVVTEEWVKFRQSMNEFLKLSEREEIKEGEEDSEFLKINLHNLGFDKELGLQSPEGHSKQRSFGQLKRSFSLKGDKRHLQFAHESMKALILDFNAPDLWKNKKMLQFNSKDIIIDQHSQLPIPFNYIEQLFLLGEIIKQFRSDVSGISHEHLTKSTIKYVNDFGKELEKKLSKEKKEKLETYYIQYGETLQTYAKLLAKRFSPYLMNVAKNENGYYKECFSEKIKEDIKNRFLAYCKGFDVDFMRAVKGKFLQLSTDKEDIIPPKITNQTRQEADSAAFYQFCTDFLRFLMQNLDIHSEDLVTFDPIADLEARKIKDDTFSVGDSVTKWIGGMYNNFEQEWAKKKSNGSDTPLEGVFKLLPILRVFNQNNILAIHKAILTLQKKLEIAELSGHACESITAQFPTAFSKKARSPNALLDREGKKTHIEFVNGKVKITMWRVAALNDISGGAEKANSSQFIFPNCRVTGNMVMEASVDNMQDWTVKTWVDIERSSNEGMNVAFLRRYSTLLALLECMGMEYNVKTTD